MLNCEFCCTHKSNLSFTRCCKTLICHNCCDRVDKKLTCGCGRVLPQGRKNYSEYPQIIELLRRCEQGGAKECDRCEQQAQFQCQQCEMIYCSGCCSEVHAAIGFSKHSRKKLSQTKIGGFEKTKRKQIVCLQHNLPINSGCECGTALCATCLKQHKQVCSKGYRLKMLKEFKEEYFLNVLLKMRQLSYFKQRLFEDKSRYEEHFFTQKDSFQTAQKMVWEQFEYLKKMVDIKYAETKTKLSQYWENCQNVYSNTLQKVSEQVKKYDSYAQLLQLFSQNLSNLDYFDKKIKRFNLNFEFVNIKGNHFQQAQNALMNVGICQKSWEQINPDLMLQEANIIAKDDIRLINSMQNTSELILDYTHNPMKDRELSLLPSHSEIYYNFIHLPYQNLKYEVEYGVGMKIKGQEIFKKITNQNGYGVIEGLNPNTKYRVRMRIAEGAWGPTNEIVTLDIPKFNIATSSFAKSMAQNAVQLGKGGIIYGSNEINFGVHRWIIKFTSKTISYEDSQTACMSVGVSNKEAKKAVFVGTTLNYGFQKSQIVLKILLDCNQKKLIITNTSSNHEQIYQNLPNFPIFPTIQNKGNGQILVRYSLTTDDSTSC